MSRFLFPRSCPALLAALSLPMAAMLQAADPPSGTLIWNNGESLKGRLTPAMGEAIGWKSELFEQPIQLHLAPLRRVEFTETEVMATEPFAVFLRDGSRVHGDITAMDADTLTLRSQRMGSVVLLRPEIVRIQRLNGAGLVYSGPCGAAAWTAVNDPSGRSDLAADPPHTGRGGVMIAPGWNHRAALRVALPERMEMRFKLSSTEQPAFGMEINGGTGASLAVQTWGDEVVLLWGSRFVSLFRLASTDHTVTLRVIWDGQKKRCAVFNGEGKALCPWQEEPKANAAANAAPADANANNGKDGENPLTLMAKALISLASGDKPKTAAGNGALTLQNRGRDLVIEQMSIREWSGNEPQLVDAANPSVALTDSTALSGTLVRISNDSATVKLAQGGEEKTVPLAQLDSCYFNVTPPKDAPASQTELWAADGSLINGKLMEVGADQLKLQTAFAKDPVNSQTTGLLRLNLDEPLPAGTPEEPPLNRMDRLVWATTTLHGTWVTTGDAALHWLPVGGVQPGSISSGRNVEITRSLPADAKPETTSLFHLKTGDVLPGSLTAVDEQNVGIESSILGIKQIPSKMLRAIQFPSTVESKGFKDGAWHVIRGGEKDVVRGENKVTLRPGTAFGHPLMLQSDEVKFSVIGEQRSFTSVRIRLFGNGDDNKTGETRIIIAHYSNRIYAGLEQADGEFANRCQVNIASEQAAAIKLVPHAKDVELFINGTSMLRIPSDAQKRKGVGLVFEPCNLWGNGEYPVVVSDFSAQSNPGRSWLPNVDAAARTQALLIPRFRKDAPPRNILVAANGDLLRGELMAGTSSHFAFQVGLDTFQIPRERVTTAVWLEKPDPPKDQGEKKEGKDGAAESKPPAAAPAQAQGAAPPAAAAPPEEEKPTHWLQLMAGARFPLIVEKLDQDSVVGHSALLGSCRVPFAQIYKIRNTSPGPDVISQAFDSWKLEYAPEPDIPNSAGSSSPLVSKDAPDFTLPMLAGGKDLKLSSQKGKVVVLDFWATWCAPCVRSMPDLMEAMSVFPADKVQFIAVNQGESAEQVKRFLDQRGWQKLSVALDGQQRVGVQFGVEGIPFTVIIGPDGKVAWTHTGYSATGAKETADAVQELLNKKAGNGTGSIE